MPDPRLLGPWPVVPNRVSRFYRGGALLDAFRAGRLAAGASGDDTDRPEDWVGSATGAWHAPGSPASDEGLGAVVVDGTVRLVRDLLAADPAAVAGPLAARAGPTTGLLVKLLDAAIRLPVHAHPTRAFARRHLASSFGKAEAWIVLATRDVAGEPPPHIRLGLRDAMTRDELGALVAAGGAGLLEHMHERPITPGDAWFVPPGTLHAIGAGALILELQEPTDFSIVAETAGLPIDPRDAHLRKGWATMLDAFDRRALDDEGLEALRGSTSPAAGPGTGGAFERTRLLPAVADPYLRAERWRVRADARPGEAPAFLVGVVIDGAGTVRVEGGDEVSVSPGSTFAVPAAGLPDLVLEGADLTLVACLPPRVDDLLREDPGDVW
jgi:mannose-6-phosphate isomerase